MTPDLCLLDDPGTCLVTTTPKWPQMVPNTSWGALPSKPPQLDPTDLPFPLQLPGIESQETREGEAIRLKGSDSQRPDLTGQMEESGGSLVRVRVSR